MKKYFITLTLLLFSSSALAETKSLVLQEKFLALAALPIINKDYYSIEFGFLTKKKSWDYQYNAYVTVNLFEDWLDQPGKLRAAGLGFKGGVVLPTQKTIPLFAMLSVGFAKTTLHKNPIFGREEQAVDRKDMLFLEAGALYKIDKFIMRLAYQRGTIKHFHRHVIFSMGVSY